MATYVAEYSAARHRRMRLILLPVALAFAAVSAWARLSHGPIGIFTGLLCFATLATALRSRRRFNLQYETGEEGIARSSPDHAFIAWREITGYAERRNALLLLTARPLGRFAVSRKIAGFDQFQREIAAHGIPPGVATTPLLGPAAALSMFLVATLILYRSHSTIGSLSAAAMAIAAMVWLDVSGLQTGQYSGLFAAALWGLVILPAVSYRIGLSGAAYAVVMLALLGMLVARFLLRRRASRRHA